MAVGGMLNTYFSGINAKQYGPVLALFDPAGSLDPNDPTQVANFTNGLLTTTDSEVVLHSIAPTSAHSTNLNAGFTFRSQQQAGFGPSDAPSETCTLWDSIYELSLTNGHYRFLQPLQFNDRPC